MGLCIAGRSGAHVLSQPGVDRDSGPGLCVAMLFNPLPASVTATNKRSAATKAQKRGDVSGLQPDPLEILKAQEVLDDKYFVEALKWWLLRFFRAVVLFCVIWFLCWTTPHLVYSKFGVATFIATLSMLSLTKWVSAMALAILAAAAVLPPELLSALIRALSN